MASINITLRLLTFLLIVARIVYWIKIEGQANTKKPRTNTLPSNKLSTIHVMYFFWFLLSSQILGVEFLSFPHSLSLQILGFLLSIVGFVVSILGRHELGDNWTHGREYQIKQNHELVTTGIYHYIRHPIYASIILSFVGGELVAESYLVCIILPAFLYAAYEQGKKEETLLQSHFGERYRQYMSRTKMLIPYIV